MTAPHSTHDHQLIHVIERIRIGDSVGFEMIYHLFIMRYVDGAAVSLAGNIDVISLRMTSPKKLCWNCGKP